MIWKKGVFSNFMWGMYTLVTGIALPELFAAAAQAWELPGYFGPIAAGAVFLLAAAAVRLLFLAARSETGSAVLGGQRAKKTGLILETLAVAFFFLLGFLIREKGVSSATEGGFYWETALIRDGQELPRLAQGAGYWYLCLLRFVFFMVGNKTAAGVWLQIGLQLLGTALFYIGFRKLAGIPSAMTMLIFSLCARPMVQQAFLLSPQPMYQLLLSLGILLLCGCAGEGFRVLRFLPAGLFIGILGYLDVGGFLLLIPCVCLGWKGKSAGGKRWAALGLSAGAAAAGFFGSVFLDSYVCGETAGNILGVWKNLYQPKTDGLGTGSFGRDVLWLLPVFALMAVGIFSYWSSRETERISMWMLMVCAAALAGSLGMLTAELPVFTYLAPGLAVLAGAGIRACFDGGGRKQSVPGTLPAESAAGEGTDTVETALQEDREVFGLFSKKKTEKPQSRQESGGEGLAPDTIKLPKYLRDPNTDRPLIPKYMQEENNALRRKNAGGDAVAPAEQPSGPKETQLERETATPVEHLSEPETAAPVEQLSGPEGTQLKGDTGEPEAATPVEQFSEPEETQLEGEAGEPETAVPVEQFSEPEREKVPAAFQQTAAEGQGSETERIGETVEQTAGDTTEQAAAGAVEKASEGTAGRAAEEKTADKTAENTIQNRYQSDEEDPQDLYGVPEAFRSRKEPVARKPLPELDIQDLSPEQEDNGLNEALQAQAAVLAEAAVQLLAEESEQEEPGQEESVQEESEQKEPVQKKSEQEQSVQEEPEQKESEQKKPEQEEPENAGSAAVSEWGEPMPEGAAAPNQEMESTPEPDSATEPVEKPEPTEKMESSTEPEHTVSKPQLIENPLPLPKPHQKKVLDYPVGDSDDGDDFDYEVDENDDFDI